jgi:hypothetical protein
MKVKICDVSSMEKQQLSKYNGTYTNSKLFSSFARRFQEE